MSKDDTTDTFYFSSTAPGKCITTARLSNNYSDIETDVTIVNKIHMLDSVHIELLLSAIKKHYDYFGYTLASYSIEQGLSELSQISYSVECKKVNSERWVPPFDSEVPDISTDTILNLAYVEETINGIFHPHTWTINRKARVVKKSLSAAILK